MYAPERQAAIAHRVGQLHRASVAELAREHGVTTETVRRDLAVLERSGSVRRVHGGVVSAASLALPETRVDERDLVAAEAKDRIAVAALDQLPSGSATLALDAGTTTGRLAGLLADRALAGADPRVVVTHAVPLAARLAGVPNLELQLLGGRVRGTTLAAVGQETVHALEELRVDVAVVGANGLTATFGLTTPDPVEAAVKRALVGCGARVVALVDSTKIGRQDLHRFARPGAVDVLVTDGVDPDERRALEDAGVEVVLA